MLKRIDNNNEKKVIIKNSCFNNEKVIENKNLIELKNQYDLIKLIYYNNTWLIV